MGDQIPELSDIIESPCAGKEIYDCNGPTCYWDKNKKICKRNARSVNLPEVVENWHALNRMNAQNEENILDKAYVTDLTQHDYVTYTDAEKAKQKLGTDQFWKKIGDNEWAILANAGGNKSRKNRKRKVRSRKSKLHKRRLTKLKTRTKYHLRK
jgi:hypothetical protein